MARKATKNDGIQISHPGRWVAELFEMTGPSEEQLKLHKNVWFRVALSWIPPRHERFDYERDMGMPDIEAVMEHLPLSMGGTKENPQTMFVFPERWLTTQEEQQFVPMLKSHPQIRDAKLATIDMVTKSALIVGSLMNQDLRVVSMPDVYPTGVSKTGRAAYAKRNKE